MILNGTHGATGVSKIRDLLNLNLGNSRTNPLVMIPPDPKDIDRIADLINLKDLPKDRNKEEETTKEEEKAEHSPRAKAHLQKEMQGQYILLQLMLIHLAVEALPSPVVMNSKKNKSQMTHFGVQQSRQLCRMKAGSQFWQNCLQQILIRQKPLTRTKCKSYAPSLKPKMVYKYSFAHGTDVTSAKMILPQGLIRPYTWDPTSPRDFPSFGFYGYGCLGGLSIPTATTLLKKIWKISKGKQGVVLLGEVVTAKEHGSLEAGGTTDEQHLVRRKAVVKGKERWCFHSNHAHIQMVAIIRPI